MKLENGSLNRKVSQKYNPLGVFRPIDQNFDDSQSLMS